MKSIVLWACILFLVTFNTVIAQSHWTPLGVYGSSITYDVKFDQVSKAIVIAGNGTTARSSDYGKTWEMKPHPFYSDFNSLWLVSRDSFMISTDTYGIIATTDGGATFEPRVKGLIKYSHVPYEQYVTGNPFDRSDLWLFNLDGYRSTDFGETWKKCLWGPVNGDAFRSVSFSPVNPLYMCLASTPRKVELSISHDGGKSWKKRYSNTRGDAFETLITPLGNIYASEILSTDSGKTWKETVIGATVGSIGINKYYIYNSKDSMVYMTDLDAGLFKTRDGDSIFVGTSLGINCTSQGKRYCSRLTIDTADGTVFTIINDTLYSLNGAEFSCLNEGFSMAPIHLLSALDESGDTLFSSTTYNYLRSTDRGKTWRILGMWASAIRKFLSPSPRIPGFIVIGSVLGTFSIISPDNGLTNWYVGIGYDCPSDAKFDPFEPFYLYAGGAVLQRVRDSVLLNSGMWDIIEGEIMNDNYDIARFVFDPNRRGVIYAIVRITSIDYALVRFTDYGKNSEILFYGASQNADFYDVIVDPTDPAKLYLGSSKGCYASIDTGRTWRLYDEGFEGKNVWRMLIDLDNPNVLYAGTFNYCGFGPGEDVNCRGGVYRSVNAGRSWERLPDQGLYNWNIREMTIVRNPKRLLVGTECGAYEYILPPVTSVESPEKPSASSLVLHQNYPNPFTSSTTITYSLPDGCKDKESLSLKIYDALGREVLDLSAQARTGNTSVQVTNALLPRSGVYVCRLTAKDGAGKIHVASRRISFVK